MAEDFLRRWSRRKHESAAENPPEKAPEPPAAPDLAERKGADATPPLPAIDELTPESDFRAFMQPKVQDAVRRVALKKLFSDPHFNIPDPYEAYSGDWTVGEPIPEEMLATLNQARTVLFADRTNEPKEEAKEGPAETQALAPEAEKPRESGTEEEKHDEPRRQDA